MQIGQSRIDVQPMRLRPDVHGPGFPGLGVAHGRESDGLDTATGMPAMRLHLPVRNNA